MFIPIGLSLNFFFKIGKSGEFRILAIIISLAIVTGAEAIVEYLLEIDPGNLVRMVTGAISGFSIGILFNLGVTGLIIDESDNH